jgi:hypothetical protein
MSLTVFILGAAHAIPVLVVGAKTKSKVALTLTAIVMGVIAVTVGGKQYAGIDLFFVLLAYALMFWA